MRGPGAGTIGVNYWMWTPTYGNTVAGTETRVAALRPKFLRIGGHANDSNDPDPFTTRELDAAVAYARAVGAEPILQVPLLADENGAPPSPATAASIVTHANVISGYAVKYFAVGNEPDLYPDQEQATHPGYTPANFCTTARSFVTAMKAADPTIQIVGPDLSWKYQIGSPTNDWMTPILTHCGELFDVVSFHRYPFAPTASTAASAEQDARALRATIASLRSVMAATGHASKPLALTETNITYDGAPEKSILDASPGTLPAALWTADTLGTALSEGLWTTLLWSISEGWTLGLIAPPAAAAAGLERPAYHALRMFSEHFGPTPVTVVSAPSGVHAYASRNFDDSATQIIVVNWNQRPQAIRFSVTGAGLPSPAAATTSPLQANFLFAAGSFSAVEMPDAGGASAWTYGPAQSAAQTGAVALAPSSAPSLGSP